jgi:hypothetical protein
MTAIIKVGYTENERLADNFAADVIWINANRFALYEQYGSCLVLVYHEQVIGKGADLEEAVADAEARLESENQVVTPVIKYLSSPYRIAAIRQKRD